MNNQGLTVGSLTGTFTYSVKEDVTAKFRDNTFKITRFEITFYNKKVTASGHLVDCPQQTITRMALSDLTSKSENFETQVKTAESNAKDEERRQVEEQRRAQLNTASDEPVKLSIPKNKRSTRRSNKIPA